MKWNKLFTKGRYTVLKRGEWYRLEGSRDTPLETKDLQHILDEIFPSRDTVSDKKEE